MIIVCINLLDLEKSYNFILRPANKHILISETTSLSKNPFDNSKLSPNSIDPFTEGVSNIDDSTLSNSLKNFVDLHLNIDDSTFLKVSSFFSSSFYFFYVKLTSNPTLLGQISFSKRLERQQYTTIPNAFKHVSNRSRQPTHLPRNTSLTNPTKPTYQIPPSIPFHRRQFHPIIRRSTVETSVAP